MRKIELKQEEFNQLMNWYEKYEKASRIKRLANSLQFLVDHSTLDRRVDFAWQKVKEAEVFKIKTFKDGELTNSAALFINMLRLQKCSAAGSFFVINQ